MRFTKNNTSKKWLYLAIVLLLSGCGGGGESKGGSNNDSNTDSSIAGQVADGYIVGAKVCLDVNGNKSCDDFEPSAITTAGGNYQINTGSYDVTSYAIVVEVLEGAIDEDNPLVPITQPYTMTAPAGHTNFVSPISTVVHNLMQTEKLSLEQAKASVKQLLGINPENPDADILDDYISETKLTENEKKALHNSAKVIAKVLGESETVLQAALKNSTEESAETKKTIIDHSHNYVTDQLASVKTVADNLNEGEEVSSSDIQSFSQPIDLQPLYQNLDLKPEDIEQFENYLKEQEESSTVLFGDQIIKTDPVDPVDPVDVLTEFVATEGVRTTHQLISPEQGKLLTIASSETPNFGSIVQRSDGKIELILEPSFRDSGFYIGSITVNNEAQASSKFSIRIEVKQAFSGEVAAISSGAFHTCALEQGTVYCWGLNDVGQINVPSSLGTVSHIAAGDYHTCAVDENGVLCWGRNFSGEATAPEGLSNISKIVAGHEHSCALADGNVECWGSNMDFYYTDVGQSRVPENLGTVTDISAGFYHTCALDEFGLHCWGANNWGQIDVPNDIGTVTKFSAGRLITCAVGDTGLDCWGSTDGFGHYVIPETVNFPTLLEVGYFYNSCAVESDSLSCWGSGESDTNVRPRFGQSILPQGINSVSAIALGHYHTCIIDQGSVKCWGAGESGDPLEGYHFGQSIVPEFLYVQ